LQKFGTGLLNKFVGSELQSELLDHITFIDTPGVLAGEKQRLGRTYNFTEVVSWFAERADMILLLFDAHKLVHLFAAEYEVLMLCIRTFRMSFEMLFLR